MLGPHWRSKRSAILCLWLLQAPVMYVVPLMFMTDTWSFDFGEALETLFDGEYALVVGSIVVAILIVQAAMMAPIRRPVQTHDTRPSYVRVLAAGMSIGAISWPIVGLGYLTIIGPYFNFEGSDLLEFCVTLGIACVIGLISAVILRNHWRDGISVKWSLVLAGFLSGVLLTGMSCVLFELVERIMSEEFPTLWWLIAGVPLISWAVMTPLLFKFARGKPSDTAMSMIVHRLFLGSLIEAVAIIPLDIMVRRKTDCYCAEGTFWSLLAVGTVGFVTFGPAVYLLPVARRRRRLMKGCCAACGYDMSALAHAELCPECGAGWKPAETP